MGDLAWSKLRDCQTDPARQPQARPSNQQDHVQRPSTNQKLTSGLGRHACSASVPDVYRLRPVCRRAASFTIYRHTEAGDIPDVPLHELAKKKTVYVWICCSCNCGNISIVNDSCPSCGASRCAYCVTKKVQVR